MLFSICKIQPQFQDEYGVYLCDKCPFEPIVVEKAEEKVVDDERICTFIGKLPSTFYWCA